MICFVVYEIELSWGSSVLQETEMNVRIHSK